VGQGDQAGRSHQENAAWFADPHYGKFGNDRTLSQSEIDTLVAWADGGAKEGDPKDAPKAIAFVEGWRIGKPDMILEMPAAFEVPASGTIDYQYVVIPSGLTEDKYVQMAEARPGNNALVHHIIAFIREPGSPWLKDAPKGLRSFPSAMAARRRRTRRFAHRIRSWRHTRILAPVRPK